MERVKIDPAMNPASLVLDNFDREQFANFWQQEHLFLKNALISLPFAIDAADLCRLIFDAQYADMVHTRLIYQADGVWFNQTGPLALPDVLAVTNQSAGNWTILIEAIDRVWSQIGVLWSLVDFLPNWAKDDIMISIAGPGGGVGPHADNYDVFLVQLCGARTWHLEKEQRPNPAKDFLPDLPLRILSDFKTEISYETKPGDVLYVPPKLCHWGVADDLTIPADPANDFDSFVASVTSVTGSIGFRSPNLENLYAYLASHGKLNEDATLPIALADPTKGQTLNSAYELINSQNQKPTTHEAGLFDEFLHGFADPSLPLFLPERQQSISELTSRLKNDDILFWGGGTFPGFNEDQGRLLLGRRRIKISKTLHAPLKNLVTHFFLDRVLLESVPHRLLHLTNALFNEGYLFWWQDQIE